MAATLTREALKAICPRARTEYLDGIISELPYLAELGVLDNARRWHHFFAQIAHESGGLTIREENLSYTAKRITEVWPARYPTIAAAKPYARNPEKLANHTYGGRMGNNRTSDGWRYRGRGLMQLTGRNEYRRVGTLIGERLEEDPDLALKGHIAVKAAAAVFADYGCLPLADKGNVKAITRKINGGYNGLADRRAWLAKAQQHWPEGIIKPEGTAAQEPGLAEDDALKVDEPIEAPAIPREPPPAAVELGRTSRKFKLLGWLKWLFGLVSGGAFGSEALGLAGIKDVGEGVGIVNTVLTALSGMYKAHGLFGLGLLLIIAVVIIHLVQTYMVEDVEEGRYRPSERTVVS